MIATRRKHLRAFALIEVLIAVLFIGVFMLALLQIRNQTLHQFIKSSDQHTGSWLAELKMAELVSQDLPDPSDTDNPDGWSYGDSGDFADYDERLNEINADIQENWGERTTFAAFEYEWQKELILIGPDFIGTQEDVENWEEPVDEYGEPTGEGDPLDKPAVRVVRVTLIVYLPLRRGVSEEDAEDDENFDERPQIKLVTYVDPGIMFNAAEEESIEVPPEGGGGE